MSYLLASLAVLAAIAAAALYRRALRSEAAAAHLARVIAARR